MENTIEIPKEQIHITGLNDRKVFDPVSLQELADSMKTYGILQNLVVRKNGKQNHYELVNGERRYRAAEIAGLQTLPCKVLVLSDEEFKEVMLIENIQREDIHPMDQAESFARLQENNADVNQIAIKVGKSVRYIKERLALNNLTVKAKELFRAGTMQLGHALILCLFKKEHQNQAIDQVMQSEDRFQYFNHPQDLREWMNRNILCSLTDAVFNIEDPDLVTKAGACTSCTKQTGANAELFNTVTEEAKCMDRKCFLHKTEVFISLRNKNLLKEFNLKAEDCPTISNSSWTSGEDLPTTKWKPAKKADECPTVTIGFLQRYNESPVAIMICTNKTCKKHFKDDAQEQKMSSVPENETASEMLKRRLSSRREKEKVKDIHQARENYMNAVADVKQQTHNEFELAYLIQIMAGRASMNARILAEQTGYQVDTENAYVFEWIEEFIQHLEKQGKPAMVTYLRKLILREGLCPEDKSIAHRSIEDDNLLQHGKSFDIEFKPFLKQITEARKVTYKEQDAEIKTLVKKEKERQKQIVELIESAEEEYPLLHQLIKSKDKKAFLSEQKLEDLSKLAFRIGLKRKKDGDLLYYIDAIKEGIKDLLQQIKANKKGA
jgi:ParB/RepB/Spo0J family partition protein